MPHRFGLSHVRFGRLTSKPAGLPTSIPLTLNPTPCRDMLELKNVKKSFAEPGGGRLPILDIPALKVEVGEQVVLVGRSGCGKTTLLHIIAGIIRPDEGFVGIDGVDIARLPEAARDR